MARRPRGGTRAQREGVTQRRKAGLLVTIQGIGDIQKSLNTIKLTIARKIANKAIKESAERLMRPAINAGIATVSPGQFGSGLLKQKSTKVVKISKKAKNNGYRVITPSRTDLNIQGDDAYYPLLLEVGGRRAGWFPFKIVEGRHFMRNARDQQSSRVRTFLRRTFLKFMDEEVMRIGRLNARSVLGITTAKIRTPFRSAKQQASFKKRGLI